MNKVTNVLSLLGIELSQYLFVDVPGRVSGLFEMFLWD
jgi:hypothetical protein